MLAVRLGRLGDLVMTAPALRWLAEDPALDVELLCERPYHPLVAWIHPAIRALSPGDRSAADPAPTVLDLHRVPASARALRALGLRPTIAVEKEDLARRALLLARRFPVPAALRPRWSWPERHVRAAKALRDRLALPDRALPGLRPRLRIADPPLTDGVDAVVLGASVGSKGIDGLVARRICAAMGGATRVRVVAGRGHEGEAHELAAGGLARFEPAPDLDTLARQLAAARVVVGGDTGPTHLAAALGRPIVLIFGPTPSDAGFSVWGDDAAVVRPEGLACAPCDLHGPPRCPLGHRRCLDRDPAEVAALVRSLAEPCAH